MSLLNPLRLIVLALAAVSLLVASAWDAGLHRRLMEPMLRFAYMKQPIPTLLRDARFGRLWSSIVAVVLLLLWWFLGTAAAVRFFGGH